MRSAAARVRNAKWSEPRTFEIEMETYVQDTHENNNDPVHFQYVHGLVEAAESEIHYTEGTTHYRIVSRNEQDTPVGKLMAPRAPSPIPLSRFLRFMVSPNDGVDFEGIISL